MTSKEATAWRAAPRPRSVPVLSKTPVGRRSFVLRLVHDRAVRAARPATSPKP
jgi:hypothetical protein